MIVKCSRHLHRYLSSNSYCSRIFSRSFGINLIDYYKKEVNRDGFIYDEKQFKVIKLLEKLRILLEDPQYSYATVIQTSKQQEAIKEEVVIKNNNTNDNSSESKNNNDGDNKDKKIEDKKLTKMLKGVYLFGSVGSGKTMLMDSFFDACDIGNKKRVHFNDFMLDIHNKIHDHKQQLFDYKNHKNNNSDIDTDSIHYVANNISNDIKLLCFDEFQVTDVADAMILARLFDLLWRSGVVLVATSNRPPKELYLNGINRQYFLPFIKLLEHQCIVKDMGIRHDYRLNSLRRNDSYYVPNNWYNNQLLRKQFDNEFTTTKNMMHRIHPTASFLPSKVTIPVIMGRTIKLKEACSDLGVCWVHFNDLCKSDKGSADYHALCTVMHTIYMIDIPTLTVINHNEARRFITLIDTMYNNNIKFIWTAEKEPFELFKMITKDQLDDNKYNNNINTLGTNHNWNNSKLNIETMRDERDKNRGKISEQTFITNDNNNMSNSPHLRGEDQRTINIDTSSLVDAAQDDLKVLEGELASIQELSFAFKRAASRLTEMSSREYYSKWRKKYQPYIHTTTNK